MLLFYFRQNNNFKIRLTLCLLNRYAQRILYKAITQENQFREYFVCTTIKRVPIVVSSHKYQHFDIQRK